MRIAFIGTKGMNVGQDAFGGFETVVTELAPRLVTAGHCVTIYCRKNLYSARALPQEVRGVKLRFVGSIETKSLGTMSNSLLSILLAIQDKSDLVMLFNLGPGIFVPLLKLFGIKVITHLDGIEWERGKWGSLARSMFRLGAFCNVKLANHLIADAQEINRIYRAKYGRDSVVIPYGAEIRNDLSSDRIREYGLQPNGYYLLATRFVPENNPLFIIRNYLRTNSQKPLVVLGSNYYKSRYEAEILQINGDRIRFLGHIPDRKLLYEFYRYSYCYIHGHSVGGTNPTMLEALANSCCVLALRTAFNMEMLKGGEYGFFFNLEAEDFVEKVNFIDSHPDAVDSFKSKAVERILTYYNWESVVNQYRELLVSVSS
jgi:glycosyltransferase involved in cell wall biosynthesis